jgi:hypothetical protein
MTNPTSNFGWQMPTSTDLVTDLPADFEVFGQAVDTTLVDLKGGTTGQVLKKNSNTDMDFVWGADSAGMTNPMTTTGDMIYSSSGSTPARLGIGTAGQVMGIAAGVPAWTAAPAATKSFSLLNSGGTALTGAQTITVSGISNQDVLYVFILDASSASANSNISIRVNGVTTSTYGIFASQLTAQSAYSAGFLKRESGLVNDRIIVADTSSNAASQVAAYCRIDGAATSGIKMFQFAGSGNDGGGFNQEQWVGGGLLNTTAITEVNIYSTVGNFDNGTVYIYGSA